MGDEYRRYHKNIVVLALCPEITELAVKLPETTNHNPADRIIVATTLLHRGRLVTADKNLLSAVTIDTLS